MPSYSNLTFSQFFTFKIHKFRAVLAISWANKVFFLGYYESSWMSAQNTEIQIIRRKKCLKMAKEWNSVYSPFCNNWILFLCLQNLIFTRNNKWGKFSVEYSFCILELFENFLNCLELDCGWNARHVLF